MQFNDTLQGALQRLVQLLLLHIVAFSEWLCNQIRSSSKNLTTVIFEFVGNPMTTASVVMPSNRLNTSGLGQLFAHWQRQQQFQGSWLHKWLQALKQRCRCRLCKDRNSFSDTFTTKPAFLLPALSLSCCSLFASYFCLFGFVWGEVQKTKKSWKSSSTSAYPTLFCPRPSTLAVPPSSEANLLRSFSTSLNCRTLSTLRRSMNFAALFGESWLVGCLGKDCPRAVEASPKKTSFHSAHRQIGSIKSTTTCELVRRT